MLTSPYGAIICHHYPAAKLRLAIERAHIESPLPELTTPAGNVVRAAAVIPPISDYDAVPGLTQCIDIGDKTPLWVVDGRPFMRMDRRTDSYRLVAENDYAFQCIRLALTQQLAENPERAAAAFAQLGDVPVKTFSRWITLAIAQRYNLTLEQQIHVSVIVAYYYYSQLSPTRSLTEEEIQLRAKFVARNTMTTPTAALELGEKLPSLITANDLVRAIAEHSGSTRLENLKFADLFTLVAHSWVGVNSRETVGVALEHIPTFLAMLYSAIDERSYRKTVLTARVESAARQAELKGFADRIYDQVSQRFVR